MPKVTISEDAKEPRLVRVSNGIIDEGRHLRSFGAANQIC